MIEVQHWTNRFFLLRFEHALSGIVCVQILVALLLLEVDICHAHHTINHTSLYRHVKCPIAELP
jgi:hypothetical protein